MDEFQESDILWPEFNEEDQKGEGVAKLEHERCKKLRSRPKTSAPILIPSKGPLSHSWTAGFNYGAKHGIYNINDDNDHDDDGDDYSWSGTDADTPGDQSMVPPHVLIARRYTDKNKMAPFSVCVGNGRKLKGREQSAARVSVLRLTGYVEK